MNPKDTSGPAFPITDSQGLHRIGAEEIADITATARAVFGMTLLDGRRHAGGQ